MKSEPIEVRGRKWNATSPQTHRERNPCPCKEMGATASKYCYTFITNSSPVSRRLGDKEGPGRRLYFQGSLFTDVIAAWQFRWRSPWGLLATSFPGLLAGWGKDPGNEVGLFGFTLQVSQYKNVYGCKAPAKRGHTVAATLRPTMLPVCGKTRHHCCAPLDTARNVSEVFFGTFLRVPLEMFCAWQNDSTFGKNDHDSNVSATWLGLGLGRTLSLWLLGLGLGLGFGTHL